MITISQFIGFTSAAYGSECFIKYIHPLLYVVCIDSKFAESSVEEKEFRFLERTGLDLEKLNFVKSHGVVELLLLAPGERESFAFLDVEGLDQHWLAWFSPENRPIIARPLGADKAAKAVHFYGYKGGQARSTVLVMLAKILADAGLSVLLVDADIEAPSLDLILEVVPDDANSTLMGACGWGDRISPISSAYVGLINGGVIDLLACRPRASAYDMDFAAFLLNTTLDVRSLERAVDKIAKFANGDTGGKGVYDVVLFDHRTGLAPSVLPIMKSWPGPAAIFVRPDGMSSQIENSKIFDTLLSFGTDAPGAFVSFSLDPKETSENIKAANQQFIEKLLYSLSDAITNGLSGDAEDIDPLELERYWVLWHHDQSLFPKQLPSPRELSTRNYQALLQLREVLGLDLISPRSPKNFTDLKLSNSGSKDEGWFILTPDVSRLFSKESKYLYIFGRKGTGKTRIVRELSRNRLGEPLLVASDSDEGGLPSGGVAFTALMQACDNNYETFWWSLLHAAIECKTTLGEALIARIKDLVADETNFKNYGSPSIVESKILEMPARRILLIDGVETAVPASNLRAFVEALFRFMATIQYNRSISELLTVRLFLRSDLESGAAQNVEQQVEGSVIRLRWDIKSILNFALGRIVCLDWFKKNYASTCKQIASFENTIAKGALDEDAADKLLLEIFPDNLERNRLKTSTFFATYFSDAGGDTDNKASFYPRLFDMFLSNINDSAAEKDKRGEPIVNGRISSWLVLKAYDDASGRFISEVRSELENLLDLDESNARNKDAVGRLMQSFSGVSTPFVLEDTILKLAAASDLPSEKVRDSLEKMKALGIFENRPGYPGQWRTGRLYKSGLAMKYVRTPIPS